MTLYKPKQPTFNPKQPTIKDLQNATTITGSISIQRPTSLKDVKNG